MSITDEYIANKLRDKFGSFSKAAKALGYSSYRPFRTALLRGLPETKRKLALMILLEDQNEQK